MWVPVLMFSLLGVGALLIILNYVGALGSVNNAWLVVGLAFILGGIITGDPVPLTTSHDFAGFVTTAPVGQASRTWPGSYMRVTLPSVSTTCGERGRGVRLTGRRPA